MKKLFLSAAFLLGLLAPAMAQVNVVPQVGTISGIIKNPTYSATSIGLVPAASATDIFCISPGATRNIVVRRILVNGTAGTAVTTPFLFYRRVSLDTGGTPATSLALPVGVPLNPADQASTATLVAYTANPTVVDSSPSLVGALLTTLALTTTVTTLDYLLFGTGVDMFQQGLILQKNTTQQLCVNLNAVSVSSGVLAITMEWQEFN